MIFETKRKQKKEFLGNLRNEKKWGKIAKKQEQRKDEKFYLNAPYHGHIGSVPILRNFWIESLRLGEIIKKLLPVFYILPVLIHKKILGEKKKCSNSKRKKCRKNKINFNKKEKY